ncbi:MAG TPA: translocation/assembly module TamB domain-containing protein [Burkholderiales bacterium]|nr:translocation/assembly module TamB domain-containing protein [Burkholderiales bacterium]
MKRRFVAGLLALALIVALGSVAGAAGWVLYTQSGLEWLATRITGFAGTGLTLDAVTGTLAGGASVGHIRYAGDDIELHVSDAYLTVSPLSLMRLRPRISGLRARDITVVTKPGEPRGRPPDSLALPVSFQLTDARVARLSVELGTEPFELTDVRLEYAGGRREHRVRDLTFHAMGHAVALRGAIDATAPFALNAAAAVVPTDVPQTVVYAAAKGDLTEITIEGGANSRGARLNATATMKPYDALPLSALTARSTALDLKAFSAALPLTSLDMQLALKRSGEVYGGELRVINAASGPYDKGRLPLAALHADLRTDGKTARFTALVADLGQAGTITGSGELDRDSAKLALTTKRLNLAALHGRLRETKLAGRADLALTRARQSMSAELTQQDMSLGLTAHHAGEAIDVPQFRARARGGEASGEAHMQLSGRRPFSLQATFLRFDPAAWGRFPAGSINGSVIAQGAVEGPQVNASFTIRDSRWLNAALAAHGTVALAGERLRNADVDATLGGNRIVAKGALGAPGDTLAVRFDAPRLAIVDERLQGTARGTVQLTGAWRAPTVRFDVTGSDLAHQSYGRVKALAARGSVSARFDGLFDVDATVRGLSSREWQLRSASASVKGTRAAHTAQVWAEGDRIDFRASATGAWHPTTGWAGTIQELVNRGEAEVQLVAPVAIAVGPQRAHAQAFELCVIGGTLAVKQLAYERGRLTTAGRFSDLPVRPMLSIAGAPGDMAGSLRLTGSWSLSNQAQLMGFIEVNRESGDVALGVDKSIRIGLQTLSVKADFAERGATFQARIRSALASANAEGRMTPIAARYSAASPVAFTADVDVARLAPFASLLGTTVLIEGEAHARLQGSGTLGDPQITGPLTADRLAIALPAEGIDLKRGTLRAQLTQREVRVESFSIYGGEGVFSAQGTLARSGFNEASVDWRAERFTVLARPDRRLVATGKGNAALRAGKLAFTGAVKANEGLFELSTVTLPTLGDDVVVVGRTSARAEIPQAGRLPRASVDVAIDLGDNVHVRGRGLDVWLAGEVRLQTNDRGEIRAQGTVDARRGIFVAYGQRLEIQHGRLFFNGPPADPALDILAMRTRQAVEAGVAVTGSLSRPLVRVVSNPPLPEGEALSWLVLGRAPGTAGPGQLAALPLAAGAIAGKAGAPLARALHLDEIGMRGGSTVSEQFLTVGKRVSDRLYVVFEQSLGGAENLLRLEYSLTQRIALRAQAGLTSSLGVFYRYGWD